MPELNAEQRERLVLGLTQWWASLCDDPDDAEFLTTAAETGESAMKYIDGLAPTVADLIATAQREAAQAVLDAVDGLADLYDEAARTRTPRSTWGEIAGEVRAAVRAAAAKYGAGTAAGGDGR